MGRIVGIDLGTTNTAIALMVDGRPKMVEDERGYKVLPSVVSARGEGRFIVGQAAASLILTHPERTVYATKRLIGRRYDSPEVQRAKARLHYELRAGPDGYVQVRLGDEWMSPAEVAAVVLQVARTVAEKSCGDTVEEAVITVPAYFNHQQRSQTMEAAQLAGLRCERLLNEPTAAALAYGHRKNVEKTLLIFDLGGGTFDVSVLRLAGGIYEILATGGDTYLGGEDFDYRIVDHLADQFQGRTGTDLRGDRAALQRLKDAAERAKCELSFSDRTNIVVPHILPGENLQGVLTRQTLESLTGDLVQRCVEIARNTVHDAGLQIPDIDDVIVVGGQTRMPKVREAVSGVFGREPSRTVHPEEAVAVGAAVHAQSLADPDQPQAILLDVTPFDLGIDASGGLFTPIVTKNSRIPCAETKTFATVSDNQTTVRVVARQGESRTAIENEFLGEFLMEDLQPRPRMQTKVDVTFRIDNNGMLNVTAVERGTNQRTQITVRNYAERAQTPRMPSREESEAEREARAKAGGGALAPVAAGAAAAKKPGLLSSLFGGKKKKADAVAPVAAVAPPVAAAGAPVAPPLPVAPVAPAADDDDVIEEAPPSMIAMPLPIDRIAEPLAGPPRIDLSEVAVAGLEDVTDLATDAPVAGAAPLDDEDLFQMNEGPAAFGLAGSLGPRGGSFDSGLDANDLFSSLGGEDGDDPITNADRRRNPFSDEPTHPGRDDPFSRPAPDTSGAAFFLPGRPADEPAPEDGDFALVEDEATASKAASSGLFFEGFMDTPEPEEAGDMGELVEDEAMLEDEAWSERRTARVAPEAPPILPAAPTLGPPPGDDVDLGFALDDLFDGSTHLERATPPSTAAAAPAAQATNSGLDFGDLFGFASGPSEPAVLDDVVAPRAATPDAAFLARGEDPFAEPQLDPPSLGGLPAPPPSLGGLGPPSMGGLAEPPPILGGLPAPDAEYNHGGGEAPRKKKKPARLKLHYRERDAFLAEYRDNLRRGGTFIRTDKPLSLGRECIFEIDAPGLVEPIVFSAVVSGVSSGSDGAPAGMTVEYKLDGEQRGHIERVLARL